LEAIYPKTLRQIFRCAAPFSQ